MRLSTENRSVSQLLRSHVEFDSEADLVDVVFRNLDTFLPKLPIDYAASAEMRIGAGIVDVVIGATHPDYLKKRIQNGRFTYKQITGNKAVVLSILYLRRPLSVKSVAKRSGLSVRAVTHSLEELLALGLCTRQGKQTYIRTPLSDQFSYLISVEGKLRNWRKALQQAYRNRLFSHYSYVVMDASQAQAAIDNLDTFRVHGVGLAVASAGSANVKIIYRPRQIRPVSSVYYVLAKEALTSRVLNKEVTLSEGLRNGV